MGVAELEGRVMASRLHIIAVDVAGSRRAGSLEHAMHRAALHLEHLERCWSRFIGSSDISRINQLGLAGGTIQVDPSTLTLLATMIDGYQATAGRFDPTVLRAMIAEGYSTSLIDPANVTTVAGDVVGVASVHDLELDTRANTVTVPPGLVLDPGGIGKGLAADLAVARLLDAGIDGAMVEIGGDLSLAGTPVEPAGWLVDVEHPDPNDGLLCSLAMTAGGVATSSVRSRRWTRDGIERHHLIDPRTGTCSTTDLAAVTVIAPAGWQAEVHASAALAAGSGQVISYIEGHGLSGIAVAMTTNREQVWTTRDLEHIDLNLRCGT